MMKRSDVERLVLSFFIAVGIFAVLGAVFYFLPLGAEPFPDYGGPMYVTLEEEPEEAEPEPDTVAELEARKDAGETPRRREEQPEAESPVREERRQEREAPPGEGQTEREGPGRGPQTPPDSEAAEPESGRTPGGGVPAAEDTETEPLPEQEEPQTAEGRGPESGGAAGQDETGEAGAVQDRELPPEEAAPEEEPGMLGDLEDLDRALAQADRENGDETGEEAENSEQEENGAEYGSPDSPIDIETLKAKRKPINMPEPEIGVELAQKIPNKVEVVVSFTLLPSGYITGLKIVRDSGNTEVDSIIKQTINKWRFEPVDEAAGSVNVLARYRIRVR